MGIDQSIENQPRGNLSSAGSSLNREDHSSGSEKLISEKSSGLTRDQVVAADNALSSLQVPLGAEYRVLAVRDFAAPPIEQKLTFLNFEAAYNHVFYRMTGSSIREAAQSAGVYAQDSTDSAVAVVKNAIFESYSTLASKPAAQTELLMSVVGASCNEAAAPSSDPFGRNPLYREIAVQVLSDLILDGKVAPKVLVDLLGNDLHSPMKHGLETVFSRVVIDRERGEGSLVQTQKNLLTALMSEVTQSESQSVRETAAYHLGKCAGHLHAVSARIEAELAKSTLSAAEQARVQRMYETGFATVWERALDFGKRLWALAVPTGGEK